MKRSPLIEKAQALFRRDQRRKLDPRYIRTIGLLAGKGMLFAPDIAPTPSAKLEVSDAYWVATHIEPRVWEVLPAALLHFPRSFIGVGSFPDLVKAVIQLKQGQIGKDYQGVPFARLKRWADFKLPDGRTKVLAELKIMRSFRLSRDCLAKMRALAESRKLSQSQLIEEFVLRSSAE